MSNYTVYTDFQKQCSEWFRRDMILQQANRMGVHKCKKKDALTCWGTGCAQCFECLSMKCYACKNNIWECNCGPGNIRIQPELTLLHPEEYIIYIYNNYE